MNIQEFIQFTSGQSPLAEITSTDGSPLLFHLEPAEGPAGMKVVASAGAKVEESSGYAITAEQLSLLSKLIEEGKAEEARKVIEEILLDGDMQAAPVIIDPDDGLSQEEMDALDKELGLDQQAKPEAKPQAKSK